MKAPLKYEITIQVTAPEPGNNYRVMVVAPEMLRELLQTLEELVPKGTLPVGMAMVLRVLDGSDPRPVMTAQDLLREGWGWG